MFKPFITIIFAVLALGLIIIVGLGWYFSAPAYEGPVSDHFDGKRFHNKTTRPNGFGNFLKWMVSRKPGTWSELRENKAYPSPEARVQGERYRVTFINHATFLIQIDGLNILTDPIWSERCSPVSFFGPKRVRAPGVAFDDLPRIDVVLISHNHYDHLDLDTLKKLWLRDKPRIIAGLGNEAFLKKHGIASNDLDWWEELSLGSGRKLYAVPAQHFSNRGLNDRNKTLWIGFVIEAPGAKIYFAGDTGFGEHFQNIRDRFGPIDLALLPIGAFIPTWFMHFVHISPEEALKAAAILEAQQSIGMHFGTFRLADDAEDEPLRELARAKALLGGNLHALDFGQHEDFIKSKDDK